MNWLLKGVGVLSLAVALNGCGGSSSGGSSAADPDDIAGDQMVTLAGRAAVGAPVVNAPIEARCSGGEGFTGSVTTNDVGGFQGQVSKSALPCALQVSGNGEDEVLHSYADSGGTVNITPFTDLILALSTADRPRSWFEQDDPASTVQNLNQAKQDFLGVLREAAYNLPDEGFDPFTSSFQINDAVDRALEAFSAAILDMPNVSSYQEFVGLITSGNLAAIPTAPPNQDSGSGGNDGLTAEDLCRIPKFNPTGTVIQFRNRVYDTDSGSEIGIVTIRQEVLGPRNYRGEATTAELVEDITDGVVTTSDDINYFSIDPSEKVTISHGLLSINRDTGEETRFWYEPLYKFPYALSIGEEYSQSVSYFASVGGGPQMLVFEIDNTIQFKGVETVTVPAGTFEACKYYVTSRTQNQDNPGTQAGWYHLEYELSLKDALVENGEEITIQELVSYSVNGMQLLPAQ